MTSGRRGCCSVSSKEEVVISSPGILWRSGGAVFRKEMAVLSSLLNSARSAAKKEWWSFPQLVFGKGMVVLSSLLLNGVTYLHVKCVCVNDTSTLDTTIYSTF